MTLRGVGSYFNGARLDIKPITVLCGKNGSGKSTWLKALNMLRRSLERNILPLEFEDGFLNSQATDRLRMDRPTDSYQLQEVLLHGDRTFLNSEPADGFGIAHPVDVEQEERFGPLGTVGLEFVSTRTFLLNPNNAPPDAYNSTIARSFLRYGKVPEYTNFRIRITPGRLGGRALFELRMAEYIIRIQGSRGISSSGYAVWCSKAFLDECPDNDLAPIRVGELRDGWQTFIPTAGIEHDAGKAAARSAVERSKELLRVLLDGYYHIGAIRHVPEEDQERNQAQPETEEARSSVSPTSEEEMPAVLDRRYVGPNGKRTLKISKDFAHGLLRESRSPVTGGMSQDFQPDDFGEAISGGTLDQLCTLVCEAAEAPPDEPNRRIWDHASEDNRSAFMRAYGDSDSYDWGHDTARQTAELLNGVLGRRELYAAEVWPGLTGEARLLAAKGVDALGEDEIRRLNRLLIEKAFVDHRNAQCIKPRLGYVLDVYVSFWLERLTEVRIHHPHREEPVHSFWPKEEQEEQLPTGVLISPKRSPRKTLADAEDKDDPLDLKRFRNKCFHSSQLPRQFSGGFHHIAPIVVQLGVMARHELLGIENPEAQLHPQLQLDVTEFLMLQALSGRNIIIETHSDLVIRRLLRGVLEEKLPQAKLNIYFTELESGEGGCESTGMQSLNVENGRITNWPEGFMDANVNESRRLMDTMYGPSPEPDEDDQ
jgi:ABC-type polar amino acid transport system ATPase subunit